MIKKIDNKPSEETQDSTCKTAIMAGAAEFAGQEQGPQDTQPPVPAKKKRGRPRKAPVAAESDQALDAFLASPPDPAVVSGPAAAPAHEDAGQAAPGTSSSPDPAKTAVDNNQGESDPDGKETAVAGLEKPGLKIDWKALGKLSAPADVRRVAMAVTRAAQEMAQEMTATVDTWNSARTWPLSTCLQWRKTHGCVAQLLWDLYGAQIGFDDDGEQRQNADQQEILIDRNSKPGILYHWTGNLWERDDHDRRYLLVSPLISFCQEFVNGCLQVADAIQDVKNHLARYVGKEILRYVSDNLDEIIEKWDETLPKKLRSIQQSLETAQFIDQVLRMICRAEGGLGESGKNWDHVDKVRNRLPTPGGVLCLDRYRIEREEANGPDAAPTEKFLPDQTLRPGRPADRYLLHTPIEYDMTAPGALWRQFVRDITGNDSDLATYLQTIVGAAICRDTHASLFVVLYGNGANGKSIFREVLTAALGDGLSGLVPPALVVQGKNNESANAPSAAHMALRGKAIAWMEELKVGQTLDVGSMKQISQGTTITAREPYAIEQVSFPATAIPFLLTNEKPRVPAQDDGTWRRLVLIPMDQTFLLRSVMVMKGINPDDPTKYPPGIHLADPDIDSKLMDPIELPGVLTWAVEGAFRYREHGLPEPPQSVIKATQEWSKESDTLAAFIDECLFVGDGETPTAEIWRLYKKWTQLNGVRFPLSKNRLTQELCKRRDSAGLHIFESRLLGKNRMAGLRGCRINSESDAAKAVKSDENWGPWGGNQDQ